MSIAILRDASPTRGQSLVEAISTLQSEFSKMRDELRTTQSENNRLRGELARWRLRCRPKNGLDLAGLRRRAPPARSRRWKRYCLSEKR